jgi:hypothetical protein
MINPISKTDRAIVFGLMATSMFVAITFIYGLATFIWVMPEKRAEIRYLQARADTWHNRAIELEAAIEDYQRALNFEKLFLLVAKPDSITLLGDLEKQIENKAEFCLGEK